MTPQQKVREKASGWLKRNRSLVLRQTPFWAQSLAGLMLVLGAISITAAIFFRIDEVVTVTGQLESSGGSVVIKTPVGGRIDKVFFKDGQRVRKGELLLTFDTRQARFEKESILKLLGIEKVNLRNRRSILQQRQKVLIKKVDTFQSITDELGKLVENGGFQKVQYLQQLDQLFELKTQLANLELELAQLDLESRKSKEQLQKRLQDLELQLQYQNVISTSDGIIFDPQTREGGVLSAGADLLTVVPQDRLIAKVSVTNKDIGFVQKGQSAKIRVDAFPFAKYGELSGKVSQIGADALAPDELSSLYRYPVTVILDHDELVSQGATIPLRSGMAITANLKLRDKPLISIISDMLVDQAESIKSIRQQ